MLIYPTFTFKEFKYFYLIFCQTNLKKEQTSLEKKRITKIFNLLKQMLLTFIRKILFQAGEKLLIKGFVKLNYFLFLKEIFCIFLQEKIKQNTIFLQTFNKYVYGSCQIEFKNLMNKNKKDLFFILIILSLIKNGENI